MGKVESNVFIFHGTGGFPGENWFPWMKDQLEQKGCKVTVPQFPTPEGQSLKAWLKVMEPYISEINENTLLIAHSLGSIFLLRFLERLKTPVRAAFFVGAPVGVEPIKNWESDSKFSGGFEFDWVNIRTKAKDFIVFHSDTDPYVHLGNGQKLAQKLGVDLTFIPNSGHFNTAAGYSQFPQLLEKVENVLVKK